MHSGSNARSFGAQRGFGYMMVLFSLAALGLMLAGAGQVWQVTQQREREAELLFIGNQFRQALASYQRASPPDAPRQPRALEELVQDRRNPVPQHHLRKLYADPMTGTTDWGLVKVADRIVGVHSLSRGHPLKTFFAQGEGDLAHASAYDQWVFLVPP